MCEDKGFEDELDYRCMLGIYVSDPLLVILGFEKCCCGSALRVLTCIEKHDKLVYVFWHGRNSHLHCEHQQTNEPRQRKNQHI